MALTSESGCQCKQRLKIIIHICFTAKWRGSDSRSAYMQVILHKLSSYYQLFRLIDWRKKFFFKKEWAGSGSVTPDSSRVLLRGRRLIFHLPVKLHELSLILFTWFQNNGTAIVLKGKRQETERNAINFYSKKYRKMYFLNRFLCIEVKNCRKT